MIRGLYTAASGMLVSQKQNEMISENIDNLQNPGYREAEASVQAFGPMLIERIGGASGNESAGVPIGAMGTGALAERIAIKNAPGLMRRTDEATDLALGSQGFFVVQTPQGERYTRDGHFHLDPQGQLVTFGGQPVLGANGPIGPLSPEFKVGTDGTVTDQGRIIDQLRVVSFQPGSLQREGKTTLYALAPGAAAATPVARADVQISQGTLEESNVDLNDQMVKMITVLRAYEANQKVIQTMDGTLEKAVNEVGKV